MRSRRDRADFSKLFPRGPQIHSFHEKEWWISYPRAPSAALVGHPKEEMPVQEEVAEIVLSRERGSRVATKSHGPDCLVLKTARYSL